MNDDEVECLFAGAVLKYLHMEWEVSITQYPAEIQGKALALIEVMRTKGNNIPNTAARIAMDVLPI